MVENIFDITLSQEEIIVLLRVLRSPGFIGLSDSFLRVMTTEQVAAALVSAERSLYARGILRVVEKEKRIEIDSVILAILGTCLAPAYSLIVFSHQNKDSLNNHYYHVSPDLSVEIFSPQAGLFKFMGTDNPRNLLINIERVMCLENHANSMGQGGRVKESNFILAREYAIKGKRQLAQQTLFAEGLDKKFAGALVKTFVHPACNGSIICLETRKQNESKVDGFSFLGSENEYWILSQEDESGIPWVNILPCSADDVRLRLASIVIRQIDNHKMPKKKNN